MADRWKLMIVTLDGPAGAGKSSVARGVARRLGLRFLDTGAMYRAVAWKAGKLGVADPRAIATLIAGTALVVGESRVTCDGEDVTEAIRTPEITVAVRPIADSPECRAEFVRLQREIGKAGGLVTEGRDQGSVVFPDAAFKFYLDASLDEVNVFYQLNKMHDYFRQGPNSQGLADIEKPITARRGGRDRHVRLDPGTGRR